MTVVQAFPSALPFLTKDRGREIPSRLAPHAMATVHPSSILRQQTSEDRQREMERFTEDLRIAARLLTSP